MGVLPGAVCAGGVFSKTFVHMEKIDRILLSLIGKGGADKISDNAMIAIVCVLFVLGFVLGLMLA